MSGRGNERPSLDDRFEAFASTLDGFESIDVLLKNVPAGRRADYLFRGRSIIAEKMEQKVEARIAWNNYVMHGFKLGKKYNINPQTTVLPEELLSTEERQEFRNLRGKYIRRFESNLDVPGAGGLVILLNEKAGDTLPQDALIAILRLFDEEDEAQPRFANINGIFLTQRLNRFTIGSFPSITVYLQTKYKHDAVNDFGEYMSTKWAGKPPSIRGFLNDVPLPD
jgi:hypothetical protein